MSSAILAMLKGALGTLFSMVLTWFGSNALQVLFDCIDEAVESVLEKEEVKAAVTPEETDNRRLAVLRKYFEGWKEFQKKSKGN